MNIKTYWFLILFFIQLNWISGQQILIQPYLQNLSDNTVTIMWEVDGISTGKIDYGVSPSEIGSSTNSSASIGSGNSRIHRVILNGLDANKK